MKKRNVFLIIIVLIVIVIESILGYRNYKKNNIKNVVQEYLLDKGVKKENITSLKPYTTNLSGDKHYLVEVKIKGDEKMYFYYKDSKKIRYY
ncbi:DUF3139 domain-containing protein [Priestia endophytica]|uniref:DUF3139 domain-containing protein n=1 Tax=Priestia endophytica TaxID=135735 RepID=UPI000DCA3315|nr:DUF3139 domain-containing protein [Priestia endophytica]RAS72823.1 hypothetical protein A4U60_24925 [Priestia endophytica]